MQDYKIYKYGFYFASSFFALSIILMHYLNYTHLAFDADPVFNRQIKMLKEIKNEKIIVYGSSGVLFGISTEKMKNQFNKNAYNFSTGGLASHFDHALIRIGSSLMPADIVIASDRNYRNFNYQSHIQKFFPEGFSLIPYLHRFLSRSEAVFQRSNIGNLDVHPVNDLKITIESNTATDLFNNSTLKLMQSHIALIKEVKGCPVLAFIPLLVPKEQLTHYYAQHKRLVVQVKALGMTDNVLMSPEIYDDVSLFYDAGHMNAKGRELWTQHIIDEMKSRNLCQVLQ